MMSLPCSQTFHGSRVHSKRGTPSTSAGFLRGPVVWHQSPLPTSPSPSLLVCLAQSARCSLYTWYRDFARLCPAPGNPTMPYLFQVSTSVCRWLSPQCSAHGLFLWAPLHPPCRTQPNHLCREAFLDPPLRGSLHKLLPLNLLSRLRDLISHHAGFLLMPLTSSSLKAEPVVASEGSLVPCGP